MTKQSKIMALQMRGDRKSRPMVACSEVFYEDQLQTYHTQFCVAMYHIVVTFLLKYVIIGGIYWLYQAIKSVAIFLSEKFCSFSRFIFNGPKEREEKFWKGYASVLGIMIGLIGFKYHDNLLYDANNTVAAYAYAQELESVINTQQPFVKIGKEVQNGERRITPLQADGPLAMMLESESKRLGCSINPMYVTAYFSANRTIESSGRVYVSHSVSKAYGLYAFKPGSVVDTAKRGGLPYTKRHWGFTPSWISTLASGDGKNVTLREDQWKVLVLLHAIMRTGSDKSLQGALCEGDLSSAKELYAKYHHTNVDEATVKRMNKYFDIIWPTGQARSS